MKVALLGVTLLFAVSTHAQVAYEHWDYLARKDDVTIFAVGEGEAPTGPTASYTCKVGSTLITVREWEEPVSRTYTGPNSKWKPMQGAVEIKSGCLGHCKALVRKNYGNGEGIDPSDLNAPYWKSEQEWGKPVQRVILARLNNKGQFGDAPDLDVKKGLVDNHKLFRRWKHASELP